MGVWGLRVEGFNFGVWETLISVCPFSYFSICALITDPVPILPLLFYRTIFPRHFYLNSVSLFSISTSSC